MAKQHRIGDCAQEHCSDNEPSNRKPGWSACFKASGNHSHETDNRCDEIKARIKLTNVRVFLRGLSFDPRHCGNTLGTRLCQRNLTGNPGLAPNDRGRERVTRGQNDTNRRNVTNRHRLNDKDADIGGTACHQ
ncbi:unannotated protein [freshwater metagenome]|uniref:Unannotated protein n=1 Tax=freshwater metagenome TaxID=449393 RepID=A0A6J6EWM4_9ZZZZ